MRQKSFLLSAVALMCALCLFLGGCGSKKTELEGLSAEVAELAESYLGSEALVIWAEDYSLEDFEGEPCHVLLLRTSDNRFLAYSYLSGQVYQPSGEAVWNYDGRLETEEYRCIYLLYVMANGSAPYVNSDEVRKALTTRELAYLNVALVEGNYDAIHPSEELSDPISEITGMTQPLAPQETTAEAEQIRVGIEGAGQYTVLTEYPELFTNRVLDDNTIASLKNADLGTLREQISTPADYAAWLDTQGAAYYTNVTSNPQGQRTFGADFAFQWHQEMLSSAYVTSLAVRILGDDLPGMGTVVMNMDYNGGTVVSGNVIPVEDKLYVFSLDMLSRRLQDTIASGGVHSEIFPLVQITGVEDLIGYCGSGQDISCPGGVPVQGFYIPGDTEVVLDCVKKNYNTAKPCVCGGILPGRKPHCPNGGTGKRPYQAGIY